MYPDSLHVDSRGRNVLKKNGFILSQFARKKAMFALEQDGSSAMNDMASMFDGVNADRSDNLDAMDREDLCNTLLESLVTMASKSKRRQADLSAALRRSGINATLEQVGEALIELQSKGCIREMVPLYDGGMLVTVTNLGMDRTTRNPHWLFLEKLTPLIV